MGEGCSSLACIHCFEMTPMTGLEFPPSNTKNRLVVRTSGLDKLYERPKWVLRYSAGGQWYW